MALDIFESITRRPWELPLQAEFRSDVRDVVRALVGTVVTGGGAPLVMAEVLEARRAAVPGCDFGFGDGATVERVRLAVTLEGVVTASTDHTPAGIGILLEAGDAPGGENLFDLPRRLNQKRRSLSRRPIGLVRVNTLTVTLTPVMRSRELILLKLKRPQKKTRLNKLHEQLPSRRVNLV